MAEAGLSAADIDQSYADLAHEYGWSFMGTPEGRLRTAQVAIVGLNPGGGGPGDAYDYGRLWDSSGDNAYFDEKWGPGGQTDSPLQTQVKEWHRLLDLKPSDPLCIQFVPFRSPNWNSLPNKAGSLAFSRSLWEWVLEISPARVFITMGKLPAVHLAELMSARVVARLPTGWGRQLIDVYDAPSGRRIIAMPHPSRYRLFGRAGDASLTAEQSFRAAADSGRPVGPGR